MDLSSLEIFRAVAREASVTRAAQQLQRAQSNVTTRIRQLEEDLGVELFLRDGKRMSLTERGSEFLAYAEQLLALADEARQSMHPAEPGGRLRLGSMESTAASRLPALFEDSRVHLGALFGLLALAAVWVLAQRSFLGFQVRVLGLDRRAAGFVGFREKRLVWFVLLFSGALAGLAGVCEVAGPIGQLVPQVSPGYGYAAITVAFLGRLNPFGILCASLLMALLYLGGEAAQMSLNLPLALTGLFQGMMLFFLLACDVLILYRPRLHGRWRKRPALRDALA